MRHSCRVALVTSLLLLIISQAKAADGLLQLGWDPVKEDTKGRPTTVTLYAVYQATDDALTSFSRLAVVDARQTTTTLSAAPGKPLQTIVYHRLQYTVGEKYAWGVVAVDEWGNVSTMSTPWILPTTPPKQPLWRRVAIVLLEIASYLKR